MGAELEALGIAAAAGRSKEADAEVQVAADPQATGVEVVHAPLDVERQPAPDLVGGGDLGVRAAAGGDEFD